MIRIGEIDTIKTLAEVNRLNLVDKVMAEAKQKFPGRKKFRFADMLDISRTMLDGERTKQGEQMPLNFNG